MPIKRILGKYEAAGCKKKGVWSAEIKATQKNGKVVKKKFWICNEHVKEFEQLWPLKGVVYEETPHF